MWIAASGVAWPSGSGRDLGLLTLRFLGFVRGTVGSKYRWELLWRLDVSIAAIFLASMTSSVREADLSRLRFTISSEAR